MYFPEDLEDTPFNQYFFTLVSMKSTGTFDG